MKDSTPLVIAALGVGAYFFLDPAGSSAPVAAAPPDPGFAPAPVALAPGSGILDGLAAGAGSLLSGVGSGIGNALGSALGASDLNDPGSEARGGFRKLGDTLSTAASKFGLTKDPAKKRKKQRQTTDLIETNLFDMEQFASRVAAAASRADVREYVVSSSGPKGAPIVAVYYSGQAAPFILTVPERAQHERLAWAAEGIVRVLGRWEQRGVGPIAGSFVRYDPPSYSDANPYAPPGLRISERGEGSTKYEQDKLRDLARRGRSLGSKNTRRGLGLDDQPAEPEAEEA